MRPSVSPAPISAAPNDRGDVSVQHLLLMPIIVLVAFMCVQMAVYFHAANVASAAAGRGAQEASLSGTNGGSGAAQRAVAQVVSENGSRLVAATTTTGPTEVISTVTVGVNSIVPFFPRSVTRTAREPRERFVAESER